MSARRGALAQALRGEMLPLLFGRVAMGLAAFVSVRILTSVMSPELYGRYALTVGYLGFVAALLVNPIAQAMNRFLHEAARAGAMRLFLVQGLRSTTRMSLLGALGLPIFVALYLREDEALWLNGALIALILVGANLRDRQLGLFNNFRWRGRYVTLASLDAWMKTLAIAASILWLGPSLSSALMGMAFGTWLLALAGLPWLVELSRQRPPEDEPPAPLAFEPAKVTQYALPLFGVNLLSWLVATSDRYVIAGVLGDADLGRFVASAQVAQAAPIVLAGVFFPMFTPILFQRMANEPGAPLHLDRYALGVAALSLSLGGLLMADLDCAFRILVSRDEYRTGDAIVPFVFFGQVCYMLHQVAEHEAYRQKRTGRLVFANGAAALVGVTTNLALSSWLGIMGAGIAASATYATLLAGTLWLYRPSITKKSWLRIGSMLLVAIGVVVLARLLVPNEWPIWLRAPSRWALFAALFGGGLWATMRDELRPSPRPTLTAS